VEITDACLDAETLAAWMDGGLTAPELERTRRFRKVSQREFAKPTRRSNRPIGIAIRVLGIPMAVLIAHRRV
jgi:hypothetical protein